MSKHIKQMEMDALKQTFQGVHDVVFLSAQGVNAQQDNQARLGLRKKNIRIQVVKNSLAKRVFDELGLRASRFWEGPTLIAWGASSVAELSRELDRVLNLKKNDKVKVKGVLAEGQEVSFQQALTMPTRAEAIARVVSLVMAPASRLVAQLQAPGGRLAAQIRTLREREAAPEGAAAAASS